MKRGGRGFDRTRRVADLLQKTLAQMLLQDMSDDRFRMVTVASVTVNRDLSYAKVYVSVMFEDAEKVKQTVDALNRSAKALRFHLAKEVQLRIAPELKFIYDETTAKGFRISDLIDAAIKKEQKE
jgi:ribosome-binding factor A